MKFIKRHYKKIVLILICIFVYLIYNSNNEKNITYISLGDGYAMGLNPYNKKTYGYSDYLKNYLEKENKLYKYYNSYSYSDMMIRDLYKDIRIDDNNIPIKQALRNSNILTISIGINDLIYLINKNRNKNTENIKLIRHDFNILIKEINKYYKGKIYLVGYYNNYKDEKLKKGLDDLNELYKKYSKEKNITYIEINNNLGKYYENPNSNYPNTLGYEQIYKKILSKIKLN